MTPAGLDNITSLAFSPDNTVLAVGTRAGGLALWDIRRQQRQAEMNVGQGDVLSLAYTPDGKTVCAGGSDGFVDLVDADSGEVRRSLQFPGRCVYLKFSPDGQFLACAGGPQRGVNAGLSGYFATWETGTWRPRDTFQVSSMTVAGMDISPDGKSVALACGDLGDQYDQGVEIHRLQDWKTLARLRAGYQVRYPVFSANGDSLFYLQHDWLKRWDWKDAPAQPPLN
jgi:WD40 repeat protein